MKVSILYHYFHPDDVISARLYSDLAQHLAGAGWDAEAVPCNRGCRNETLKYPGREEWEGVSIRRVWRPAFSQRSKIGRIVNSVWMIWRWAIYLISPFRKRPDVVVMGTDPPCSAILVNICRLWMRQTRFVLWVHDLYPEAAVAGGIVSDCSAGYRSLFRSMTKVYSGCSRVVDIGPCMRRRIEEHASAIRSETITPWAMYEPVGPPERDAEIRRQLFGDAKLGLLYSGNFGLAHEAGLFMKLACMLKGSGVAFAFAVRGNCVDGLKQEISIADADIRLVPFAEEPEKHLAAADIHLVSLKPAWSGLVVPSKYFGALAVGRPVLYAGAEESDIGIWTKEHSTGWVLNAANLDDTAEKLRKLAEDKSALAQMGKDCFRTYHEHFSRKRMLERWSECLKRHRAESIRQGDVRD